MTRQFRGDRLYKLLKISVIVTSIFCLVLGIYAFSQKNSLDLFYLKKHSECISKYHLDYSFCDSYLDQMHDYNMTMWQLLIIGVLLPIIFFGGGTLLKYLFPIKKE